MTQIPKPLDPVTGFNLTWDAWNRLVKVADSGTSVTVAEYRYDGRNYRIAKMVPNGANWDRTDFYYTGEWQGVEDRVVLNSASKDTVATAPKYQYAWDSRYIDAVLTRDENKDGDGLCTGTGDERLYYAHDTLYSTRALLATTGSVVERNKYDAYGKATVCDAAGAPKTDTDDGTYANQHFFTGQRKDSESQLQFYKLRLFACNLGRFLCRDPFYQRRLRNLFEYVSGNPANRTDRLGLFECFPTSNDLTPRFSTMDSNPEREGTKIVHSDGEHFFVKWRITPTNDGGSAETHANSYVFQKEEGGLQKIVETPRAYHTYSIKVQCEIKENKCVAKYSEDGPAGKPKDDPVIAELTRNVEAVGDTVTIRVEVKAGLESEPYTDGKTWMITCCKNNPPQIEDTP
jgi:RHS repeat-associated protein